MENRKTWFSYLSIFLYICGGILIFVYAINGLGNGQEYPYYVKGMSLFVIAVAYLAVAICSVLGARMQIEKIGEKHPLCWKIVEWGLVVLILAVSFVLRIWVIKEYPMKPQSDYKTYYEIAQLLNRNALIEEGPGYCDYIAIFPHVLGYSYVLSVVMKIFGQTVWIGQLFNVIFAVITCFFIWRIAVMLGGRISGMSALVLTAFWPSQILYQTFLASEYVFSLLMAASIWLFLILVKKYDATTNHPGTGILLHILLGILIGLDAAIRPMALLFLITVLICIIPCRLQLPIKPSNDLSLGLRVLEKGAIRGGIILGTYIITSMFITKCVSFAADEELATGTASFGYNLLVGLNQESYGGWNEEDSEYLYEAMDSTGSPVMAQIACRDLAFQRLKGDKKGLFNMLLHKYDVLWSNDDYATSFNLIFLKEQGNLTKQREDFLLQIRNYGNYWYLICVAFSMIAAVYMLKGKGDWSIILIILFLGTVAMHLIVENQNRYHFHALYLLVILTSQGMHYIYQDMKERIVIGNAKRDWKQQLKLEQELAMTRITEAQKYADEQRKSNMEGCFDMNKALKAGHIVISVTQMYDTTKTIEEAAVTQELMTQEGKTVEDTVVAQEIPIDTATPEVSKQQQTSKEPSRQYTANRHKLNLHQENKTRQRLHGVRSKKLKSMKALDTQMMSKRRRNRK